MGRKGVIALLSCVFALCLALVGCGGSADTSSSGNAQEEAKAAFVGTWDLVGMSQDGEVTDADDLESLKALGLEVYVNFNEDGTAALVMFGEPLEGEWEAESATQGAITLEGQEVSMTISDSKLTFEQADATLTFEKGEAKEVPDVSAADAEGSESSSASSSEASESSSAASSSSSAN